MDLRTGIIDTARALGMNPLDLATIISYETAGTFDPTKRGPTTQWGQHRGLIQFGEPQAQQFGVDWNDPVRSQLGADGAIAKYYRASGWKPGMGLLDAYSVVNAGAPGRYNASDANNGGAPGTVRDKVEQQMTGHREKAAALLGGDFTASGGQAVMTGGAGDDTMQTERRGFLGRMFGDMDPERRDKLIVALEGMTHNPNQALMDQAQGRIDERRIDARTAAQVNKTVEYLRANGSGDLADAVASGVFDPGQAVTQHYSRAEAGQAKATEAARREQAAAYADQYGRADVAAAIRSGVMGPEEGGKMILTGEKIDERYKVVGSQLVDLGAEGGPKVVLAGPGEGDKPLTEIAKLKADLDAGRITPEEYDLALQRMAPKGTSIEVGADGSVRFIEGVGAGAAPGERISYSPTEVQAALDMIDAIAADPGLPRVTGPVEGGGGNDVDALNIMQRVYYGSGGVSLIEKIGQLQNTTWLAAREMLKGGGAITDYESKKAEAAMSRMSRTKDEKEFQAALKDLRDAIVEGQRKIEAARGGAATQPSGGTTVRRFNPETGKLE